MSKFLGAMLLGLIILGVQQMSAEPKTTLTGPTSDLSCADFLKRDCSDILSSMLHPLLIVGFLATPADALPGCDPTTIERLAASLSAVEKTATPLPQDDPRYGMHEGAEKAGLSAEEAKQVSSLVGVIACPYKGKDIIVGNATIVGDDADFIATNSHIPITKDGEDRFQLSSCFFAPKARTQDHYYMDFANDKTRINKGYAKQIDRDFALIKLKKSVPNVKPLPIAEEADKNLLGDVIVVSAFMPTMPAGRVVYPNEPVVQLCGSFGAQGDVPFDGVILQTKCASDHGASGSMVSRRENNQLKFAGILKNSGENSIFVGQKPDWTAGNSANLLMVSGAFRNVLNWTLKTRKSAESN